MTIQHTPNYGIAYADEATALVDLAAVTQEVAQSLDAAMGAAGYTPPDASSFAAEVAARTSADSALNTRVTALETPPAWQALAAASGWSTPSTEQPPAIIKNASGLVTIQGSVVNGTGYTPGATIAPLSAALPVGYRPIGWVLIGVQLSTGATVQADLSTAGVLHMVRGAAVASGVTHYINVSYRAA